MSYSFYLPLLTYPDPTTDGGIAAATAFAAFVGASLRVSSHVVDIPPISNPLARAVIDYSRMATEVDLTNVRFESR